MADSHTQFFSSQQPCLFRRYGYYSSENVRELPIWAQKKAYVRENQFLRYIQVEILFSEHPGAISRTGSSPPKVSNSDFRQ